VAYSTTFIVLPDSPGWIASACTGAFLRISFHALKPGLGLGFAPTFVADECPDLVEIIASKPEWDVPLWLITHVELHQSAKVQALLQVL